MANMRITAATERYALLGESLAHTWSPQIHNTLFDAARMDAVYIPMPVPGAALSSAVDVLRTGFSGFNVTIPYKEAIIPFLDELSETANACGAVNTVEITARGTLIGHNTDGEGLRHALQEVFIIVDKDTDVVILGAGGAARVATYEMLRRGAKVTLAVRNREKGLALAREMQPYATAGTEISVCAAEDIDKDHSLLLNCTPVGMYPHSNDCPVNEGAIKHFEAVFDMVYNPPYTRLVTTAQGAGIKAANGFGMLFYQAAAAQKIWLGREGNAKTLRSIRKEMEALL